MAFEVSVNPKEAILIKPIATISIAVLMCLKPNFDI
jgi:hypothetical protein